MKPSEKAVILAAILVGALVLLGFSPHSLAQPAVQEDAASKLRPEAAFFELEPIGFSFQNEGPTLSYLSSRARVFYMFHPANEGSKGKPLFVFFNGGPGCATCDMLFSLNTAPYTLDVQRTGGRPIRRDITSWTKIGNLLHIDAPDTGFSYNLMENPEDPALRAQEFEAKNFNTFIDAAQMVRVVLRFLAGHPSLQRNPLILVGESYGGTRMTIMLHMLLYYARYGDGSLVYKDQKLAEEIGWHLDAAFPDHAGYVHPPEEAAQQFGRQIMIQPMVSGSYQDDIAGEIYEGEGSVIYRIAAETGTVYEPCPQGDPECEPWENAIKFVQETAQRDPYKYDEETGWIDHLEQFSEGGLSHVKTLSKALGVEAGSISGLPASQRDGAYRYLGEGQRDLEEFVKSPRFFSLPRHLRAMLRQRLAMRKAPPHSQTAQDSSNPTLEQAFGSLNPWDAYIVGCNDDVIEVFYVNSAIGAGYSIDPLSNRFGKMFLEVLPLVDTLITDAELDLIVYAAAVAPSFEKYTQYVKAVFVQKPCLSCDGFIVVNYQPFSLPYVQTPQTRSIYFPHYGSSGHPVSASMPEKFLQDVTGWISWERGTAAGLNSPTSKERRISSPLTSPKPSNTEASTGIWSRNHVQKMCAE